jgi:hypothetical protein
MGISVSWAFTPESFERIGLSVQLLCSKGRWKIRMQFLSLSRLLRVFLKELSAISIRDLKSIPLFTN